MNNDNQFFKNNEFGEYLSDEEIEQIFQNDNDDLADFTNEQPKKRQRLPRLIIWLIAIAMIVQSFAFVIQTYSIPALEFLSTSARLLQDDKIATYKKAVVTITSETTKGTGFSISDDGLIVTNYHVIEDETEYTVVFPDGQRFPASVVETDPAIDLALLKTNGVDLPFLKLAQEESTLLANDHIYFIGNPLRFHGIANEGKIIDYIKLTNWQDEVVMMKAPVYRGNSGSPVINNNGEVIGVVFATLKHDEHGKVGLFVPITYFQTRFHKG